MATKKSSSSTGRATQAKRTPKSKPSGLNATGTKNIERLLKEFEKVKNANPYQPKSVFPSEMFFFRLLADALDCDQVIESGGRVGGSTSYLAALFNDVHSVCEPGQDDFGNVAKYYGDSNSLLPLIADSIPGERIAVLIDGPKGQPAVELANKLLENKRVAFVAVHDLTPDLIGDRVNSQNETFRESFGFLDDGIGEYREKYPNGPGLTVFSEVGIAPITAITADS